MILVTGGLGFIGLHTARALLDLGEACLLTRHQTVVPAFAGDAVVERLDLTDEPALLALGRRYDITGVIHLAAPHLGRLPVADELEAGLRMLFSVLRAAEAWGVRRVTVAST